MQQYQRILTSINLLIENSKEMQNNIDKSKRSPISIGEEFCTIKVCTARQTGHSLAIAHFLLNRTNEYWAIISPTIRMGDHNMEIINDNSFITVNGKISCTISARSKNKIEFYNGGSIVNISQHCLDTELRGRHFNGIIIDNVSIMCKKSIDEIYNIGQACMAKNRYMYFIFIE